MICKSCGKEFESPDKKRKFCDDCSADYQRVYYNLNRDKKRARSKQYYEELKAARDKLQKISEVIT